MTAYYNEIDPYAAAWLRNLIAAGHIADGVVDERDIRDVHPIELREFAQCHFFAGIGVWSLALRSAGWPDTRGAWTGSCPCQPFSSAGRGAGFADERHLWPAWHHLIRECRPQRVFGEQVASADAGPWIDLVQDDLEALGYAFGAVPFPAASVGAPHIRDRLYFVADALGSRRQWREGPADRSVADGAHAGRFKGPNAAAGTGEAGLQLADASGARLEGRAAGALGIERSAAERGGGAGELADGPSVGRREERPDAGGLAPRGGAKRLSAGSFDGGGAVGGFWSAADWIPCRDGKWRPVESGLEPLVDGAAGRLGRSRADQERLAALLPRNAQGSRVGRLRAYGNAICAPAAEVFIRGVIG